MQINLWFDDLLSFYTTESGFVSLKLHYFVIDLNFVASDLFS